MKLLLLFLFPVFAFSQTNYNGYVSENGMPLPGVNICVRNTQNCTSSDLEGKYTLKVKVGDELVLTFVGLKTQTIKIKSEMITNSQEKVQPIFSDDFIQNLKKTSDSATVSMPSGSFNSQYLNNIQFLNIKKISREKTGFYTFKNGYQYQKLGIEINHDFTLSEAIRPFKLQNNYAQGRSINSQITYQGPETNEIFSFGPNLNTLEHSNSTSEFYPNGAIVNNSLGNGTPVKTYDAYDFFQNALESKSTLRASVLGLKGSLFEARFAYNLSHILIPESKNYETASNLSYEFNNIKNHQFRADVSYSDFKNNRSNSNFAINKIIYANLITPNHFDNALNSTLANGFQRSFSQSQNNPYYLVQNNLDDNKSKIISVNLKHNYTKNKNNSKINVLFQSSEIGNTNGQSPYFNGINIPNYNHRFEKFKNVSISELFQKNLNDNFTVESKIDFRYQERTLQRIYFEGYQSPADFPFNSISSNKLDVSQDRYELFYNLNGTYSTRTLNWSESVILKINSDLNYSSTVKGNFLSNFSASGEFFRLFDENINFTLSQSFVQVEPSLQNNNLNFNSLRFDVNQFLQLNNNAELFTKNGNLPTNESQTNLGLRYNWKYRWSVTGNFYHKKVENLYAPILNSNQFAWSPEVNYKQYGAEFELERLGYYYQNNLIYQFNLNFTMYRNRVTSLNSDQNRVPFAGFADVNKNYIVGEPLGAIVGSSYLRDENQNVIIDDQGFPIEDANPKILGDPNPDFVVGFYNSFKYKSFTLKLSFDWSQGGEMWNGTQQTLNYFGRSEVSSNLRNTTNYVFNGVTQSGNNNVQPVDFYNDNLPVTQNRWTRYGIDGVAEDAIEDATYFRLNSANISYSNVLLDKKINFSISLFVNNVFVISKSKNAFANNSLFNSLETNNLEYFNSPMMRTFGTSVNLKF